MVTHHFTVDVEEYFHVSAFESRDSAAHQVRARRPAGAPVLGFRALSFSIVTGQEWALDILDCTGRSWSR